MIQNLTKEENITLKCYVVNSDDPTKREKISFPVDDYEAFLEALLRIDVDVNYLNPISPYIEGRYHFEDFECPFKHGFTDEESFSDLDEIAEWIESYDPTVFAIAAENYEWEDLLWTPAFIFEVPAKA